MAAADGSRESGSTQPHVLGGRGGRAGRGRESLRRRADREARQLDQAAEGAGEQQPWYLQKGAGRGGGGKEGQKGHLREGNHGDAVLHGDAARGARAARGELCRGVEED